MKHYLYELWSIHPQAKKSYIGMTKNPEARFSTHKNRFSDTHAGRAVRKYGPDSFRMEILDCADGLKEIRQLENETILDRGIKNLWNLMMADEYTKMPKVSDELRKNMSESAKARWENPEERKKTSDALKALWENPEERKRQSDTMTAVCANPEYRQKMSEAIRKRPISEKGIKYNLKRATSKLLRLKRLIKNPEKSKQYQQQLKMVEHYQKMFENINNK